MANGTVHLKISDKITLLAEFIPHFYSFALGFFINSGSRDEEYQESGITHLIEHMLFKGTGRRSALEIVKRIEALGGSFDAFTSKENVIILCRFLTEHLTEIFDLIAELLLESSFDPENLEKEKAVVLEELKTQLDDPEDFVFDQLFDLLLSPHPFSYPISGREESLRTIDREKITGFYKNFLAQRFVIAIAGNFNLDHLLNRINDRFQGLAYKPRVRTTPRVNHSVIKVQRRSELSQVYVALGSGAEPYRNPERYPMSIFNTAFGGAMSSRLFQSMREQEGLVYNVQSLVEMHEDCGFFSVYFVTDKDKLKKSFLTLASVFKALQSQGFEASEVETARSYIKGNLLLSLEQSTSRMLRLGRNELLTGTIEPVEVTLKNLDNVSLENVNRLIEKYIRPQDICLSVVGPSEEEAVRELWNSAVLQEMEKG
ncbi:MAG: pitrilysin family protein [candidate division WOR-3 bacterium]